MQPDCQDVGTILHVPFKKIIPFLFPFLFLTNQAQRQMSLEIPIADQQERILKFLSAFDPQKSAGPIADTKISGITGNHRKNICSENLQICY